MQPQLPQNLAIRPEDGVSGLGLGDSSVLAIDDKHRDWWLYHFGVFVEPNDYHIGVESYKVWRLRENTPVFNIAYGATVGALWVTIREMVHRAI
jgi:hypothetical protein